MWGLAYPVCLSERRPPAKEESDIETLRCCVTRHSNDEPVKKRVSVYNNNLLLPYPEISLACRWNRVDQC